MSKKLIILTVILITLFTSTHSQAGSYEFKARTLKECIDEPDCAYFFFKKLIVQSDGGEVYIRRWDKPINIYVLDSLNSEEKKSLDNAISKFKRYIPLPIKYSDKSISYIFLFSENSYESYTNKYKQFFRDALSDIWYETIKDSMTIPASDSTDMVYSQTLRGKDKTVMFAISLLDKRERPQDIRNSISRTLFRNLVTEANLEIQDHFKLSNVELTPLHMLITMIVYRPEFKLTNTEAELKSIFYENYHKFLNDFRRG